MSRVARRGLFVFIALLVLLLAGFAYEAGWLGGGDTNSAAALPVGGPFSLIDQNGATRNDSDFRGKLMLVYFGYTYCPDICPATLLAMSQALDQLGPESNQVQPIFITVDPERDTPAQMKLYASNFHPRLLALTGGAEALAQAERDYRVYAKKVTEPGKADYLMDHSSFIYLMDRDGKLAALISPGADPAAMAAAIRRHL
jgi:protein SCO1/2